MRNWQMHHIGEVLTKNQFPLVFKRTWDTCTTLENSVQGFKRSGLFPLTIEGIDRSKLGPSKLAPQTESVSNSLKDADEESENEEHGPSEISDPEIAEPGPIEALVPDSSGQGPVKAVVPASSGPGPIEVLVQASTSSVPGPVEALLPARSVPSPVEAQDLTNSEPGPAEALVVPNVLSDLPKDTAQQEKYKENAHKSLLVSAGKPSVKVLSNLTNKRRNEDYVSPVMQSMLQVPEPPKKKTNNTLCEKLPKALSGKAALDMMRERQRKKEEEQRAKEERKRERERKRKEKEEEKNRKKIQRMEKQKKNSAKKRKRANRRSSSESSNSDIENIDKLCESDSDLFDEEVCAVCAMREGDGPADLLGWMRSLFSLVPSLLLQRHRTS